jgi:hypothetical protein
MIRKKKCANLGLQWYTYACRLRIKYQPVDVVDLWEEVVDLWEETVDL